jgi:hypothetical protein
MDKNERLVKERVGVAVFVALLLRGSPLRAEHLGLFLVIVLPISMATLSPSRQKP